uniref:Uncharacterized protein n=1 Tax=Caenorhabditis japonica TaxID=281687 RepID=A0A8R1HZL3_CAEJA
MQVSSHPTFIPHRCPSLQTDIVFVRKSSGIYTKYLFDPETAHFKQATCTDCHLNATEKDLMPLYAVWSNHLSRYVILAKNSISHEIQQFVYSKEMKRFEQVNRPELKVDLSRTQTSNTFFTVGGPDTEGVTVILRDPKGHFRKEQFNFETNRFEVIPPVPVKFLPEKPPSETPSPIPITIHVPVEKVPEILRHSIEASTSEQRVGENVIRNIEQACKESGSQELLNWLQTSDFEAAKEHEYAESHTEGEYFEEQTIALNTETEGLLVNRQLSREDVIEIRRLAEKMGNPVEMDSVDSSDLASGIV